jgi:hypothetical protein
VKFSRRALIIRSHDESKFEGKKPSKRLIVELQKMCEKCFRLACVVLPLDYEDGLVGGGRSPCVEAVIYFGLRHVIVDTLVE